MPILLHFIRSFRHARKRVGLPALVFAVAALFLIRSADAQVPPALEVRSGLSWEGQADGRKTHDYELSLAAGAYLFIEVEQFGADVSTTLHSPKGGRIATADGPEGPRGTEMFALVTDTAGTYRFSVTFQDARQGAGHYVVRVRDSRPAKKGDELRVKAVSALAESQRLRARDEPEARDLVLAKAEESLVMWRKLGDPAGEVETLNELGQIYKSRGDFQKSVAFYEQAQTLARQSGYREGEAWALSNLGYAYLENQDGENADKAIGFFTSALDGWTRVGRLSEQGFVLKGLGRAYLTKGDSKEALQTLRKALVLTENARDLIEQGNVWNDIGFVHYLGGDFGQAQEAFERALSISREAGDPRLVRTLENNLASIYHRRGQFHKSVAMYTRLLEESKPNELGLIYYNLGSSYMELGDLNEALQSYQRSREAYHQVENENGEVNALTGIGWVRQSLGDSNAALQSYEQASKLISRETWSIPYFTGLARLDLRDPRRALESLEKALKKATANNDLYQTSATLLAMASAYRDLGKPEVAIRMFGEAIHQGSQVNYSSVVASGLLRRAKLRRDEGQLADARDDLEKALDIVESTWRNIAGDEARTGFFASRRTSYEAYIDLLMRLDTKNPDAGYKALALEASERSRARGLLDLLAEGRIDVSQGLAADLRQKEADLLADFTLVQQELRKLKPETAEFKKLRDRLDDLNRRRRDLDGEIRERHPRYAQVRYPVPRKLADIQKDLDPGTALLEYALGEERSVLFVVTREGLSTYDLPSAEKIAQQVSRLRGAVERENRLTRREYLEVAHQLYNALVAPAAAVLANKPDLLIAPDRALYYIPFEIFLTEEAGDKSFRDLPYLLRQHSIAYIPSASVLAGLREPKGEPVPADRKLLMAFAPFAGIEQAQKSPGGEFLRAATGPGSFLPLPASRREVAGLAKLYAGSSVSFFGNEASEENVKHNPDIPKAQRLHFATHAQLDEKYPELSFLAFSESASAGEDGLLQVQEIFNLKLSADFAVLSACETGGGKEVTGEGLIGLTRAFFYAGVPSLVVSLWNVTDGPTPDLMLDFYSQLDHLGNKSAALRQAKLQLIQKSDYAHPSYWAAFVLIGEPR